MSDVPGALVAEIVSLSGRRLGSKKFQSEGAEAAHEWYPSQSGLQLETGVYFLRLRSTQGGAASAKFVWLDR